MKDMNTELKKTCQAAFDRYMEARDRAIHDIEDIVKAAGGFIPTLPCSEKCHIYATFCYDLDSEDISIYGIRYVDGEGLFICTADNVKDYEYDNDYCFDYLYDFEGEDLEEINKVLDNLAYYIPFDHDNLIRSATAISILGGLTDYLG